MELRTLTYFLAVAREQSINRAAESLHMTQPPLSRQMMELEKELGKQLFIRSNRRITLTEEGMILRKRAEEMLELAAKTKAEVASVDDHIAGDVYIGGGETEGFRLVASACRALHAQYPDVRFHLFSGNAPDVAERLDRGLLDFAVVVGQADVSRYHQLKLKATDRWGVLVRRDHPLAAKESIRPADLAGVPLLASEQALERGTFDVWAEGVPLSIACTYNLLYNAALMVEEGLGSALCLHGLMPESGRDILCFRSLFPVLEADLSIIWKKDQILSKASEKLLELILLETRNLNE